MLPISICPCSCAPGLGNLHCARRKIQAPGGSDRRALMASKMQLQRARSAPALGGRSRCKSVFAGPSSVLENNEEESDEEEADFAHAILDAIDSHQTSPPEDSLVEQLSDKLIAALALPAVAADTLSKQEPSKKWAMIKVRPERHTLTFDRGNLPQLLPCGPLCPAAPAAR